MEYNPALRYQRPLCLHTSVMLGCIMTVHDFDRLPGSVADLDVLALQQVTQAIRLLQGCLHSQHHKLDLRLLEQAYRQRWVRVTCPLLNKLRLNAEPVLYWPADLACSCSVAGCITPPVMLRLHRASGLSGLTVLSFPPVLSSIAEGM